MRIVRGGVVDYFALPIFDRADLMGKSFEQPGYSRRAE